MPSAKIIFMKWTPIIVSVVALLGWGQAMWQINVLQKAAHELLKMNDELIATDDLNQTTIEMYRTMLERSKKTCAEQTSIN